MLTPQSQLRLELCSRERAVSPPLVGLKVVRVNSRTSPAHMWEGEHSSNKLASNRSTALLLAGLELPGLCQSCPILRDLRSNESTPLAHVPVTKVMQVIMACIGSSNQVRLLTAHAQGSSVKSRSGVFVISKLQWASLLSWTTLAISSYG